MGTKERVRRRNGDELKGDADDSFYELRTSSLVGACHLYLRSTNVSLAYRRSSTPAQPENFTAPHAPGSVFACFTSPADFSDMMSPGRVVMPKSHDHIMWGVGSAP
ncbi:hypothetical protein V6N12_071725 [Hibiscus sabdariffa]|uniref:Uncharacterized protein n=1 Tax=Hibiscus sabdariffa TaxID=183260 RepID=A0ABR2FKZ4_9ROSI